jgi:hypothetical protein
MRFFVVNNKVFSHECLDICEYFDIVKLPSKNCDLFIDEYYLNGEIAYHVTTIKKALPRTLEVYEIVRNYIVNLRINKLSKI